MPIISTRSCRCLSDAAETQRVRLVRQSKRGQLLYKQCVFRHTQSGLPTCFIHPFLGSGQKENDAVEETIQERLQA